MGNRSNSAAASEAPLVLPSVAFELCREFRGKKAEKQFLSCFAVKSASTAQ